MAVLPYSESLINPGAELGTNSGWHGIFVGSGLTARSAETGSIFAHSGNYFFHGGANSKSWSGQWITIPSSVTPLVDQGIVTAYFSAFQTGFDGDTDKGGLNIDFYNGSSLWLANGLRDQLDIPQTSGWQAQTLQVLIPKNARYIHAGVKAARVAGTELSQYWDDFNLVYDQSSYYSDQLFSEKGNNQNSLTVVSGTAAFASSWFWGPEHPMFYASASSFYQYVKSGVTISASYWDAINSGFAIFNLDWNQGDFGTNDDLGRIVALFTTSAGTVVGSFASPTSRSVASVHFLPRSMSAVIPASSALITIQIEGQRVSGSALDAYASRINLSISAPNSLAAGGGGGGSSGLPVYARQYPNIYQRRYPELIGRKYPPIVGGGSGGGSSDPNWSSVVFLSGYEGADTSTAFVDESSSGKTLTANANAQVDTAQKKYGASAALFDGTGDYISTPAHADFDFPGQYTIETFVRFAGAPTNANFLSRNGSAANARWFFTLVGGSLYWRYIDTADATKDTSVAWSPVANTWYHIAVDKDASNVIRLYIDGVKVANNTFATGVRTTGTAPELWLGVLQEFPGTYDLNGWLDETRITKGVARYATDTSFTVPSEAYPRS